MAVNIYPAISLIGGGEGSLDSIDGDGLASGDGAIVITMIEGHAYNYTYRLDSTSGAVESSPDIISPDANAGDKRWILTSVEDSIGFPITAAGKAILDDVDVAAQRATLDLGSIATKDIWTGTQTEYDALGTYDSNTIYFITED